MFPSYCFQCVTLSSWFFFFVIIGLVVKWKWTLRTFNIESENLYNIWQVAGTGTISMEQRGSSLRDGTSGFRSLRRGRAFALCILWRILLSGRDSHRWRLVCMDRDSLVLELRFLELMISIYANTLRTLTTSGEVVTFLLLFHDNNDQLNIWVVLFLLLVLIWIF